MRSTERAPPVAEEANAVLAERKMSARKLATEQRIHSEAGKSARARNPSSAAKKENMPTKSLAYFFAYKRTGIRTVRSTERAPPVAEEANAVLAERKMSARKLATEQRIHSEAGKSARARNPSSAAKKEKNQDSNREERSRAHAVRDEARRKFAERKMSARKPATEQRIHSEAGGVSALSASRG